MRESVFKIVFLRNNKETGIFLWLKLLLLEVYLGEQLLEMLTNTSSYNTEIGDGASFGTESNGWKQKLVTFIPATFLNKLLQKSIIQLLEVKYVNQYKLLILANEIDEHQTSLYENSIYKLNNQVLYLLTELKLSYNTIWVCLNLSIDLIVFAATTDIVKTLATGALIEFIRRFKI
ncbi:MAG: hypothetical protein V6Z89_26020 [Desulfobacter sp.]